MEREEIVNHTTDYVRERFEGEPSGHDWWHLYRVWKNSIIIGEHEDVDMHIVQLAALLHDIADWKFNNGNENIGLNAARELLGSLGEDEEVVTQVCEIIETLSFKGAGVINKMKTKEGEVVQDADYLDAIGAIGIARTFAYGGSAGRVMYDPSIKPEFHDSFESYKRSRGTVINHFYEKLLLIKDLLNTDTARNIAKRRQQFMEDFLKEFYQEWEGKT